MSHYRSTFDMTTEIDPTLRVAFVTGEFNRDYTGRLETVNEAFLRGVGITRIDKFVVP